VIAICDGERFVLLPAARDHKRAFDGDAGANTGGMGAFAPLAEVTPELEAEIGERIVAPVLRVMAGRGAPYRGALYVGLMLGAQGPRVVEFNARFGDPETQVILPLLGGSFCELLEDAAAGRVQSGRVQSGRLEVGGCTRLPGAAVAVAITDVDYPGTARGGGRIAGLELLEDAASGVTVFHAGTRREDGVWCVAGGRAAYVMAEGEDVAAARARAYAAIARLGGDGWRVRRDIAASAEQRTLEHGTARPAVRGVD
jgi:phosphoribosylamine--glycine ligase